MDIAYALIVNYQPTAKQLMQQAFANAQSMYTRLMIFTNGIGTVKLFSSTSHFNLMFRYRIELFCAINRARFSTGITLIRMHIFAWQNTLTILLLPM